jgi:signal transduction histidine kinase
VKPVILGGRHAISYKIGLLFIPFLIISIPLTEGKIPRKLFLQWTFVSSLSLIFTFFVILTCDKTLLRNRFEKPISNNALFLFGGFIGAVRGIATYACAEWIFHIPSNTVKSGVIRIGNAALLGSLSIPLIALMSFSYYEISRSRKESLANLIGIDQILGTTRDQINQEQLSSAIAERLQVTKAEITALAQGHKVLHSEAVAEILRKLSSDLIRRLSHRVAKLESSQSKSFRDSLNLLLLIPDALKKQLPWILMFHALGAFRVDLQLFGVSRGTILLLISNVILGILLIGLSRLFQTTKPSISRIFWFPIIAGVLQATINALVIAMFGEDSHISEIGVEAAWTTLLIYAISFAGGYLNTSIETIESSQSQYLKKFQTVTFQRNSNTSESHQLARFLHGSLQTKLSTSVFRVLQARNDRELRDELLYVADYLKIPDQSPGADATKTLIERFQEIKESWAPLIEIRLNAGYFDSQINSVAAGYLFDLMSEAISNAYRHGGASSVWFIVKHENDSIILEASNDGAPIQPSMPGLGSQVYDLATHKNWSLENKAGRVTLIATIPLTPGAAS